MNTITKSEKQDYKTLPDKVPVSGPKIPNLSAKLVKRSGKLCLYQRSDNVYEVFIVQVAEAGQLFGVWYPERETYPSNNDFGKTAWCARKFEAAERIYKEKSHGR